MDATEEQKPVGDASVSEEDLAQQYLEGLHALIIERPEHFIMLICEAVLERGDLEHNPFYPRNANDPAHIRLRSVSKAIYGDLAQIFLDQLQEALPALTDEYISLRDWIAVDTPRPFAYTGHFVPGNFTVPLPERVVHIFFEHNEEKLGYTLLHVCQLVYHGVPLYRQTSGETGKFEVLPFTHEDYIYLAQKGKFSDTGGTSSLPEWATTYYFKRSHLEAHKIFFAGDNLTDSAVTTLRNALRQHIGFDHAPNQNPVMNPRADHESKLYRLIPTILARYYGPNFNINDQSTWTRQEDVKDWLERTYNINDRESTALDLVTRPDRLRRK